MDHQLINRPAGQVRRRRLRLASLLIAACWMFVPSTLSAADKVAGGTSSRQAKKQAIDSLPYHQINEATKKKLSRVLTKPSFYRRLPATSIEVDPDYLQFLVRYPEVIVNIWQLMGVTKMECQRTGPFSMNTNDGAGTISSLELVYGSRDLHIYYGRGSYEGPVIKKSLTGDCVLILRTNHHVGAGGSTLAKSQLDVFLKVDNATANIVAKTLQPLVGPTADHNFVESLKFVQRLNETTRNNGPGVQEMAKRFSVKESVRSEFIEVAGEVFRKSIRAASPSNYSASPIFPASYSPRSKLDQYSLPASSKPKVRLHDGAANLGMPRSTRSYGHQPPTYPGYPKTSQQIERTAHATTSPYGYSVR